MFRKVCLALLPVIACAGSVPTQAAPTSRSFAVSGTVGKQCTTGTLPTIAPNATANSTGTTLTFNAPLTWSFTVVCNTPGTLTITSTPLKNGTGSSARYANYTTTINGWNGTPNFRTTANRNGSPASSALSVDSVGPVASTVIISVSAAAATSNENANPVFVANGVYAAAISVTLTAK
jgi:hypothetical protein